MHIQNQWSSFEEIFGYPQPRSTRSTPVNIVKRIVHVDALEKEKWGIV